MNHPLTIVILVPVTSVGLLFGYIYGKWKTRKQAAENP